MIYIRPLEYAHKNETAAPAYMRFAEAGRGLVLLGGKPPRLNASHAHLMINVMSTYEPYVLTNESIARVRALTEGSGAVGGGPVEEIAAGPDCAALSAVGWHVPNIVQFVPLLESLDVHNRYTGWALSTMAHDAQASPRRAPRHCPQATTSRLPSRPRTPSRFRRAPPSPAAAWRTPPSPSRWQGSKGRWFCDD